MTIRDDIPLGTICDASGNILTHKNSDGFWFEYTYDASGNILTHKDSDGYWAEYTYDASGNILTYTDSDGVLVEYTRDANGNILTYKNSDGVLVEYTRDASGNVLTYANSAIFSGALLTTLARDSEYDLMISEAGQVKAGCRRFDNVDDALKHWDRKDERARLFTETLKEWIAKSEIKV